MDRIKALPHLEAFSHDSEVLKGNPMDNPIQRSAWLLHPLDRQSPRMVVYVLDGYFGNGLSMVSDPGPVGTPLIVELLQLQEEAKLPASLFVFVDASTRLGGSQYINSSACGAFGDYCALELPEAIDQTFGTTDCKRIVMGHSSGGYGALRLPMDYPGRFHGSVVSAADSLFGVSVRAHLIPACIRLEKAGGIDAFLEDFFSRPLPERCSFSDFQTLMTLALASCYTPAPHANAAHCELPFDLETLSLREEIWDQWLGHDPVHFPDTKLRNLESLAHLHLDCGRADEYGAQFGHRQIARRLAALGIPHLHEEFDGTHSGTRFRIGHRLALLGQKLFP